MSPNTKDEIKRAAATAKDLLGQLGPLVWALHECRGSAAARAILLSVDPGAYVEIGVADPWGCIRKRVVNDLNRLRQGVSFAEAPRLFRSKGLRATINRSIVTYAVAVLEQFLDGAGKPVFIARYGKKGGWRESFGFRCRKLCEVGVSVYCCQHYAESALLALMRHKIVHVDAKVDKQFLEQVACIQKEAERQLRFRLSDDGSSVVWMPSGGQELSSCWICKDLSLAIDEVILPLLRDAQAFVGEAEHTLLKSVTES